MQKVLCVLLLLCSACFHFSCNVKKVDTKKATAADFLPKQAADTVLQHNAEIISLKDQHALYTRLNTQRYIISTHKTAVIEAEKGLRITVDPGKLEKENGEKPGGEIQVEIIELTNAEELFKANASTVSNGRLLASGGCYYIGMTSGSDRLRIRKGESLLVDFPVLKETEMELFYAERDAADNLNWQRAGFALQKATGTNELLQFNESGYDAPVLPGLVADKNGEAIVYRTLDKKVFLNDKMMTVRELIDSVNKDVVKIIIDTVRPWPKLSEFDLSKGRVDTAFLVSMFGPREQFILKTVSQVQKEKLAKAQKEKARNEAVAKWEPKSLAGVLQKYYSPSPITKLGWINCDRFYNLPQNTELEATLPITFNGSNIQYFLLYTSLNACVQGNAVVTDGKLIINNQPAGTALTIVAFTKINGEVFHCKRSVVTSRDKNIQLKPEYISMGLFSRMFGRNVKT